jgi:hypothetical protein
MNKYKKSKKLIDKYKIEEDLNDKYDINLKKIFLDWLSFRKKKLINSFMVVERYTSLGMR